MTNEIASLMLAMTSGECGFCLVNCDACSIFLIA